jgi:hypothetical protein
MAAWPPMLTGPSTEGHCCSLVFTRKAYRISPPGSFLPTWRTQRLLKLYFQWDVHPVVQIKMENPAVAKATAGAAVADATG